MSRQNTPAAFVAAVVTAYEKRRMDPAPALRQAGLSRESLRSPDARVAVESFEALSACAMRELDDEALGWFSRRLPWGSYGMLLRASLTAPTLEIALRRWCRHHGLLTDEVSLELSTDAATAAIRLRERTELGPLREFCLVSLLRNLHGVACWLADSRIALRAIRFPYAAPAHAALYRHMFPVEATFDAADAELRLDTAYLALPVVRDDAALRRILLQPIRLMARQYRQDRLLSQRIARFIASDTGPPPTAETVAAHFGISVRSLQRHLADEGTTLLALAAGSRRRRAEALLVRSDLPLKRIAGMMGYSDESTFGRAFLRWTGTTPAAFRRGAMARPDRG